MRSRLQRRPSNFECQLVLQPQMSLWGPCTSTQYEIWLHSYPQPKCLYLKIWGSMLNDGVKGYRCSDGKICIRNVIVVAYLVECTHHLAREIQWPFWERNVYMIGIPWCNLNDYSQRMMRALCTHSNVALSSWCLWDGKDLIVSASKSILEKVITLSGHLLFGRMRGNRKTIARGRRWLEKVIKKIPNHPDERASLVELAVGTICRGSDGTSGITANPAVGSTFDKTDCLLLTFDSFQYR